MAKEGITLVELAVAIGIVAMILALAVPRYADLKGMAQKAQRQEVLRNLRSTYAIYVAQHRTVPTWNALKTLMGEPTNLRLSSSCPSGTTVAYWDHNENAACNVGERLAYLYADEACTLFLIGLSSTTVTVPIRCLRGHPETLD